MHKIKVCCAVITNEKGHVLLVQRPSHKSNANQWEFPGGKVESNESLVECIHREITEELSIEIQLTKKLRTVHHQSQNSHIELHPFICTSCEIESIQLNEHQQMMWVSSIPPAHLHISSADLTILQQLFEKNILK